MNFFPGAIDDGKPARFRAEDGAFAFDLTGEIATALTSYRGRAVNLGVRPEHVRVVAGPHGQDVLPLHSGFVLDVIEPMGNEIFVHARAGTGSLVARIAPAPLPEPGSPIELAFDLGGLHFFDARTSMAIGGGR